MKYIKPKIQILELKEDIACICGSNCYCSERNFWRNKCDCKDPWWWPFNTTKTQEDSQQEETNNAWNNEW